MTRTKHKKGSRAVSSETVEAILKDYAQNDLNDPKCYKNQYNRKGLSYRKLAEKYDISLSTVTKIIRGKY